MKEFQPEFAGRALVACLESTIPPFSTQLFLSITASAHLGIMTTRPLTQRLDSARQLDDPPGTGLLLRRATYGLTPLATC